MRIINAFNHHITLNEMHVRRKQSNSFIIRSIEKIRKVGYTTATQLPLIPTTYLCFKLFM